MLRLVELICSLAAGMLGLATLSYLAFGPMTCETPSSCHGMIVDSPELLVVMTLVVGAKVFGAYIHAIRDDGRGFALLWLATTLLILAVLVPYAGALFVPTAFFALVTAIIGTVADRRDRVARLRRTRHHLTLLAGALGSAVGILTLSTVGLLALGYATGVVQRPVEWDLPVGYRGWVAIEYGNPTAPPLQSQGATLVVDVPVTGHVCTSTPVSDGWGVDHYEYVDPDGRREDLPETMSGGGGMIWAGFSGPKQASQTYPREAFFVGTEQELTSSWGSQPRLDDDHWPGCTQFVH